MIIKAILNKLEEIVAAKTLLVSTLTAKGANIPKGSKLSAIAEAADSMTVEGSEVTFGAINSAGDFQPLDVDQAPPTEIGTASTEEVYVFLTSSEEGTEQECPNSSTCSVVSCSNCGVEYCSTHTTHVCSSETEGEGGDSEGSGGGNTEQECPNSSTCSVVYCLNCGVSYCSTHDTHECLKCPDRLDCSIVTCAGCGAKYCSIHSSHECALKCPDRLDCSIVICPDCDKEYCATHITHECSGDGDGDDEEFHTCDSCGNTATHQCTTEGCNIWLCDSSSCKCLYHSGEDDEDTEKECPELDECNLVTCPDCGVEYCTTHKEHECPAEFHTCVRCGDTATHKCTTEGCNHWLCDMGICQCPDGHVQEGDTCVYCTNPAVYVCKECSATICKAHANASGNCYSH